MRETTRILALCVAIAFAAVSFGGCSAGTEYDGNYRFGSSVSKPEREAVKAGVEAMERWLEVQGNVRLKRLSVEVDDDLNTLVSRFAYYHEGDPLEVARWFLAGGAIASGDVIYMYVGEEWHHLDEWQKSYMARGKPIPGAGVSACARAGPDCQSTWTASDGTFSLALDAGEYDVVYRVVTRESTERGRFTREGRELASVAVGSDWVTGLEATVRAPL